MPKKQRIYEHAKRWFWKYKVDHIVFWLLLFLSLYDETSGEKGWDVYLNAEIIVFWSLNVVSVYTNLLWIVPNWLNRQKYLLYGIMFTGNMLFFSGVFALLFIFFIRPPDETIGWFDVFIFYRDLFFSFMFANTFALFLNIVKSRVISERRVKEMEQERIAAELNYLKAQINPHFLFNGINSIYHLINLDTDLAGKTLLHFSDLLRYQLYECNDDFVLLDKELGYLQNYIQLEKVRRDENFEIRFESHTETEDMKIAPMILLTFIENAFKHTSAVETSQWIHISIMEQNESIRFQIENSIGAAVAIPAKERSSGIGIENVKRRLGLIYPDRFQLDIRKTETTFKVSLIINTKKD